MKYQNDLILKAARGEKTDRTPVWLMRQAGRILPEYRKVRNSLSGFKELVETPDLAAEVTIQPVDILKVDAAIIFSDILVIPEAMGLTYEMVEKKGPIFPRTITCKKDIDQLNDSTSDELQYVFDAIKVTKKELNNRVPLIGFAGAPWTILAYMVEGSGSKTFSKARKFLYTESQLAELLLEKITWSTIEYLKEQIKAGADMIQLFDSWAGILPQSHYANFSLKYISMICEEIQEVPITVFAKGAWWAINDIAKLDCRTIGLDWNMDPIEVKKQIGNKTLQGNLDPCILYSNENQIVEETKKMLDAFNGTPHIANLGHGVYPDTDPEKVKLFVESVKNLSTNSH